MQQVLYPPKAAIGLPSDQDFTGRTLGATRKSRWSPAAIESGTLTSTKGNFVEDP